jgi:hypothetical protein
MSLFRKKPASQAERLAAWRLDAIASRDFSSELGDLLAELGLDAQVKRGVFIADVADRPLFVNWLDEDRVLAGYIGLSDTHDPRELTELLHRNLDPWLVWFALGDTEQDSLGARFKLPLDGFDRPSVLLALETMAGLVDDDAVAARARELRAGPAGEMEEQAAAARTSEALVAGAEAAGLSAREADGVWAIEAERGTVQAIPRDTGESVLFMHEVAYDSPPDDITMLRWLLLASDAAGARLGLAPLPGGDGAFTAASVPAADLRPQAVAWGVEQVLRLADAYDEAMGRQ